MGVYRTLRVSLPCARCGVVRRTDVQFKTADDQAMPVHDDDDVLNNVQPDVYEGIADAYCGACTRRWSDDETRAWCDVVAEEVEAGRAEVARSAWRHGRFDRSPAPGQVVTLVEPPPLTAAAADRRRRARDRRRARGPEQPDLREPPRAHRALGRRPAAASA